jgi:hypothetical protein
MPPSQYITILRVNKAAELLGQKEIDILEIVYLKIPISVPKWNIALSKVYQTKSNRLKLLINKC